MKVTLETLLHKGIIKFDCQDEELGVYYTNSSYCVQTNNPFSEMFEEVFGIYYSADSGWILTFGNSEQQTYYKPGEEIEVTIFKEIEEL